jgi:GT2 family glycosyltransferase
MGRTPKTQDDGVSIVIPTWQGKEMLDRFLPSVIAAAEAFPGACEVIVSDDDSTDSTIAFLEKSFPDVKVVRTGIRKGFAGATNTGIKNTRHRIVVLLNNDTDVDRDFLCPLVRHFDDERVFAVLCKCYDWDGKRFRDGGKIGEFRRGFFRVHRNYDVDPSSVDRDKPYLSFYAAGAFSAFDRDKLEALDMIDELFAPFNWEDADLSYRAWKRGWEVRYEPTSVVRHRPNTTVGRFRRSYVKLISRRNRLLFVWKNLTDVDKLVAHFSVLLLESLYAFLRFDALHFASLGMAMARLPDISRARRKEKAAARRTDREILILLKECYERPEVRLVD